MQFLYRIQPTRPEMVAVGPTPQEQEIVAAHFEYLKQLTTDGVMILVGRTLNTDASTFGIAIFKAETEEEARAIMLADPAVANGVMRAELFPYRIALLREQNA
jgi:uncharacterized protein YciI